MLRQMSRMVSDMVPTVNIAPASGNSLLQCLPTTAWRADCFSTFTPYEDPDYIETELTDIPNNLQGSKRVSKADKRAKRGTTKGPSRTLRYERIPIPPEVDVLKRGPHLSFAGPLGSNGIDLKAIDRDGLGAMKVVRRDDGKVTEIHVAGPSSEFIGTAASLIRNKVHGVVRGYLMYLQLAGVGYRVSKETRTVTYEVDGATSP